MKYNIYFRKRLIIMMASLLGLSALFGSCKKDNFGQMSLYGCPEPEYQEKNID